ncbi:unnamed protein product [Arctogadus glacialis]
MGLKWYPHPETLHCIKGCEPFMGDNYCDSVNNRAFCNYDGGDCCQSTVKTKKPLSRSSEIRTSHPGREPPNQGQMCGSWGGSPQRSRSQETPSNLPPTIFSSQPGPLGPPPVREGLSARVRSAGALTLQTCHMSKEGPFRGGLIHGMILHPHLGNPFPTTKLLFMGRYIRVIPFPMSCDIRDECSCRDPNSLENRKEEHVHSLG